MQHKPEEVQHPKEHRSPEFKSTQEQAKPDQKQEDKSVQKEDSTQSNQSGGWLPHDPAATDNSNLPMSQPLSVTPEIENPTSERSATLPSQPTSEHLSSSRFQHNQPMPSRKDVTLPSNPIQQNRSVEEEVTPQLPRLPVTHQPIAHSNENVQQNRDNETVGRELNRVSHNPKLSSEKESPPRESQNSDSKLIMVVDDSQTVRNIMALILNRSGYRSVRVASAMEALHTLTELTPDLIFLDITLPGMDGLDVCKIIKENPRTKQVPVIMLSGNNEVFDKVMGRLAGASDYITKPFEPEKILKCLQNFLGEKKSIKEGLWQGIR